LPRVDVVAAVLLPRLFVVARSLGLLRAEADGGDLLGLHAEVVEVLLRRVGTPLAERQVVLLAAALVGIALDADFELGVLGGDGEKVDSIVGELHVGASDGPVWNKRRLPRMPGGTSARKEIYAAS